MQVLHELRALFARVDDQSVSLLSDPFFAGEVIGDFHHSRHHWQVFVREIQ